MTKWQKNGLKKAKETEVVQRLIAPKNRFWNIARYVGIGATVTAQIVEVIPGIPEWIKGIAEAVKWGGLSLFGSAQLTRK